MGIRDRVLEVAQRIGELEAEVRELEAKKSELRKLRREFNGLVPEAASGKAVDGQREGDTSVADRVVAVLSDADFCQLSVSKIAAALGGGVSPSTVRTVSARLVEEGRLERPSRGVYRLVQADAEEPTDEDPFAGDDPFASDDDPFANNANDTKTPATGGDFGDDDIPF